jgi:hypothetical protein
LFELLLLSAELEFNSKFPNKEPPKEGEEEKVVKGEACDKGEICAWNRGERGVADDWDIWGDG